MTFHYIPKIKESLPLVPEREMLTNERYLALSDGE